VTATPEIPDSISPEMLDTLLRGRNPLPISQVVPALDFGGELGAPCDLQFAICQLIERSTNGTNIIQMLVAAMHLLTDVESHFEKHLNSLALEDEPYDQLPAADQQALGRVMRAHTMGLKVAVKHLEDVLTQVGYPFYSQRAQALIEDRFKAKRVLMRDFRSHLLISDELLDSLDVERSAVTTYLDHITDHPNDSSEL
jgi:hypothetical protein